MGQHLAHHHEQTSEITPHRYLSQRLTEDFYRWEIRGRGWLVWDYPVEIEPPFVPFWGHNLAPRKRRVDDGHHPSLLASIASIFKGAPPPIVEEKTKEIASPAYKRPRSSLIEVQVCLPTDYRMNAPIMERLLMCCMWVSTPLSFEVIGTHNAIVVQLACDIDQGERLIAQLQAFIPQASIGITQDYLWSLWGVEDKRHFLNVDFELADECMLPLAIHPTFEIDPLSAIMGVLDHLYHDEVGIVQVLFQPVEYPWAESILRVVTDMNGGPFFADAPEITTLAKEKVSRPLYATCIRVGVKSPDHDRVTEVTRSLALALMQLNHPRGNELIPRVETEEDSCSRPCGTSMTDMLLRETHRSGMLLNSAELISLVHFPNHTVTATKLQRPQETHTKKAPDEVLVDEGVDLGNNEHHDDEHTVRLTTEQRLRHTYVIGASGTGKSTLLLNLIVQDIHHDRGVAVLDPHGDLIDEVMAYIPSHRHDDVILFDPSDTEYPVGFNILSAHSDLEKTLIASDLTAVFKRLSTSWGDQMTSILSNGILAFLESSKGGTLIGLRRFLVDKEYRTAFLKTVTDPEVRFYWEKEFHYLSGKPQGPVLTRLDTFLRPKIIRNIVAQKDNKLNFGKILARKQILLCKISQGAIGEENAYLLGTLLVSKLHQLVIARQELSKSQRSDFYLYIDEFQNFVTPSMERILSGGRKYGLALTLANQELRQITHRSPEVASSIIANPYTRICFRLGDHDAKTLADGFSFFEAKDLQNLKMGEAIARVGPSENDFNLTTYDGPLFFKERIPPTSRLVELTRKNYARPKAEVEAMVAVERGSDAVPTEREKPQPPSSTVKTEVTNKAPPPQPPPPPVERKVELPPKTDTPQPRPPERPTPTPSPETKPQGKGGEEHVALQSFIKQMAQDRGFCTVVEKEIQSGKAKRFIDLALEKGDRTIACEISVTTDGKHELGNVKKCLSAGFDTVLVVSDDPKHLKAIQKKIEAGLKKAELKKQVRYLTSDECVAFLDEVGAQTEGSEEVVKGRRVKTTRTAIPTDKQRESRHNVHGVIAEAMKRREKGK